MDIAGIKRAVNLRDLLPAGTRILGSADKWRSPCLIHGGERLSFSCSRLGDGDHWRCHACGERGDVLDFVAALHKTDLKGAARALGFELGERRERRPLTEFEKFERFEQRPPRKFEHPTVWLCAGRGCWSHASTEWSFELPPGWAWVAQQPWCPHCVRRMMGFPELGEPAAEARGGEGRQPRSTPVVGDAGQQGSAAFFDTAQFVGPRRGNQPEPARLGGRALFEAPEGLVAASAASRTPRAVNPGPGEMLGARASEGAQARHATGSPDHGNQRDLRTVQRESAPRPEHTRCRAEGQRSSVGEGRRSGVRST